MKNKTTIQTTIEDQLYLIGLILLLAAPVLVLAYCYLRARLPLFAMPCLLRTLTGYYCPGCGGTRAVWALLHLQLWRSFCYHPMVPYGAALYAWFMLSHTIEKISHHRLRIGMKWNPLWLWIALVILLLNVLVKDGALLLFHVDLLQIIS
ncbi:MAG: DUF2752 domain-containing protein [Lachnospiraceae bacterium]|nr:DUF2752 domain-containing protein [Lachnospiraceae bacterium]